MYNNVNKIECKLSYHVVQANELIRAKQESLTILEAKLVRIAISQIMKHDEDLQTYTVKAKELAAFLNIEPENVYTELDNITNSLMQKIIKIQSKVPNRRGEYDWEKFHWVEYARYRRGTGEITIRLSSDLRPYLLGLNELFTQYGLENIIALPTNYAIRTYELLVSFQNILFSENKNFSNIELKENEIVFDIPYLREYYGATDKYKNTGDFIKRIIEPAVKSINNKTILSVSYRKINKGRAITHIVFKLNNFR